MMTYKDVASFWGVTVRAVNNWVRLGRLTPIRMSKGTVRFERAEVIEAKRTSEMEAWPPTKHDPSLG